jgi:hypothetical protein
MDDGTDFALLMLPVAADMVLAELWSVPVETVTDELKAKHDKLSSAGHRCANPFTCARVAHECYMLEVYGF